MPTNNDLKTKFQKLKNTHHAIFPQISDKSVFFTLSNDNNPPYNRTNTIRYMYVFVNNEWSLVLGVETLKSKAFMESLLQDGIITSGGDANYLYPERMTKTIN